MILGTDANKQKIIDELDRLQSIKADLSLKQMREKYIFKDLNDSEIVRDINFIKSIRNQYDYKNAFKC